MTHETIHPSLIEDWRQLLADEDEFARTALKNRDRELAEARAFANVAAGHQVRAASYRALLREHDSEHADQYAEPEQHALTDRERYLADWRALVAFWEQHLQVPVPGYDTVYLSESDGLTAEDVCALAVALGVPVSTGADGRRVAQVSIGTLRLRLSARPPSEPEPLPEAAEPTADAEAVAS